MNLKLRLLKSLRIEIGLIIRSKCALIAIKNLKKKIILIGAVRLISRSTVACCGGVVARQIFVMKVVKLRSIRQI